MIGFDGETITEQVYDLIKQRAIGSILLTAKNLKSRQQKHSVLRLMPSSRRAHDPARIRSPASSLRRRHPVPLVIGLDQENGGVNSLFDEIYILQYPSAMGIAATGSKQLAFEVAKSTAEEISACGINLVMGPCLDVLTNARNQPLGVRTAGDDPQQVSDFGIASMKGYQAAGVATMGKHFPSYGNLEFVSSALDVPTITDSLQQLSLSALVPFRNAIGQGLDAMMVGGCAMSSKGLEVMHACLSDRVVDGLLRTDLKFDGVVISECLEMDALSHNIGVGGGTVVAVNAGCDLVLLCRSYAVQLEAMAGLKAGIESGVVDMARVWNSLRRVLALKSNCTTWEKALNPPGISLLSILQPSHTALSTRAYNSSITVVRDRNNYLPLPNLIEPDEELLLGTPLVKPLAASAAARARHRVPVRRLPGSRPCGSAARVRHQRRAGLPRSGPRARAAATRTRPSHFLHCERSTAAARAADQPRQRHHPAHRRREQESVSDVVCEACCAVAGQRSVVGNRHTKRQAIDRGCNVFAHRLARRQQHRHVHRHL